MILWNIVDFFQNRNDLIRQVWIFEHKTLDGGPIVLPMPIVAIYIYIVNSINTRGFKWILYKTTLTFLLLA